MRSLSVVFGWKAGFSLMLSPVPFASNRCCEMLPVPLLTVPCWFASVYQTCFLLSQYDLFVLLSYQLKPSLPGIYAFLHTAHCEYFPVFKTHRLSRICFNMHFKKTGEIVVIELSFSWNISVDIFNCVSGCLECFYSRDVCRYQHRAKCLIAYNLMQYSLRDFLKSGTITQYFLLY